MSHHSHPQGPDDPTPHHHGESGDGPGFVAARRRRTRFAFTAAAFLLTFNLLQPVLSVFTTVLDPPVLGPVTWGWLFAAAQFIVPLAILQLHVSRSDRNDRSESRFAGGTPRGEA